MTSCRPDNVDMSANGFHNDESSSIESRTYRITGPCGRGAGVTFRARAIAPERGRRRVQRRPVAPGVVSRGDVQVPHAVERVLLVVARGGAAEEGERGAVVISLHDLGQLGVPDVEPPAHAERPAALRAVVGADGD